MMIKNIMSFENNIKEWVNIDNKIRTYNNEVKRLRQQKDGLKDNIIAYIETNNLSDAQVQISDGVLKFQSVKQTSPLTFKFLETCLIDYLEDEEKVKNMIKYIKSKRESSYRNDIKRNYNKQTQNYMNQIIKWN